MAIKVSTLRKIGVAMTAADESESARLRNAMRLIKTMDEIAASAAAAGLTEEILVDLLAEECRAQSARLLGDPQEKAVLIEMAGAVDSEGWK